MGSDIYLLLSLSFHTILQLIQRISWRESRRWNLQNTHFLLWFPTTRVRWYDWRLGFGAHLRSMERDRHAFRVSYIYELRRYSAWLKRIIFFCCWSRMAVRDISGIQRSAVRKRLLTCCECRSPIFFQITAIYMYTSLVPISPCSMNSKVPFWNFAQSYTWVHEYKPQDWFVFHFITLKFQCTVFAYTSSKDYPIRGYTIEGEACHDKISTCPRNEMAPSGC